MQSVYPPVNEITTKMHTDECEAAPAYSSVCTYAAVIRIVRKRCNTKKKKIKHHFVTAEAVLISNSNRLMIYWIIFLRLF